MVHSPLTCQGCGAGLGDAEVTAVESRQVFDLPERRAEVTEHLAERRRCGCGTETKAAFPSEATAPACFGPAVRAAGVYLLVRHHIPIARAAEMLSDLLGVAVSTGFLASLTAEAADRLGEFMAGLGDALADDKVAGADETSVRVAGAKWWFHVCCTALFTFLAVHPNQVGRLPRANPEFIDHSLVELHAAASSSPVTSCAVTAANAPGGRR